jgi:hypothetical protein
VHERVNVTAGRPLAEPGASSFPNGERNDPDTTAGDERSMGWPRAAHAVEERAATMLTSMAGHI